MNKWLVPLLYVWIMITAYFYRDEIMQWLEHRPSPLLMIVMASLLALFPVVPYKLVIAAIGMIYGPWGGASITVIGSTLSGAVLYAAGAIWYKDSTARWLQRFPGLERFTAYLHRHPFESIILYRLLPVVPQWVINLYAGISSIPFRIYVTASVIGKLPGILVYAFLGSSLFSRPLIAIEILGLYMAIIGAAVWGYKRMSARKAG
ncbi:TVP38/TMEM64 family protein [Paenibacillus caui]|uniref:TVP38/TMEM64 family protein n=1 Tax=Paenibacillus caui TaxID=2873927 RepID=UPI001CA9643B|nr:VTT domain-containing protein [Paenibacillus caui]